LLFDSQSKIMD